MPSARRLADDSVPVMSWNPASTLRITHCALGIEVPIIVVAVVAESVAMVVVPVNVGLSVCASVCVPDGRVATVVAVEVSVVEKAPDRTRDALVGIVSVADVVEVIVKPLIVPDMVMLGIVAVPVNVGLSVWARVCVPAGKVDTVVAVAVTVSEKAPDMISVALDGMVNVADVVEVIVRPLIAPDMVILGIVAVPVNVGLSV